MYLERFAEPMQPRGGHRQKIAQGLLDQCLAEIEPHPVQYRPLRYNIEPSQFTYDMLEEELRDTLFNYTTIAAERGGLLAALLVDGLSRASDTIQAMLEGNELAPVIFDGPCYSEYPHPKAVNDYIAALSGFTLATMQPTHEQSPALQFASLREGILHNRLRDIADEAAVRGIKTSHVPLRIFTFTYDNIDAFNMSEQELVIHSPKPPHELLARFRLNFDQKLRSDENNGRNFMSGLFAASWAIETRHPGISSFEATRILLRNADVLGSQAWHKTETSPHLYRFVPDLAANEAERFSTLIRFATVDRPMICDNTDRLILHKPITTYGLCPVANAFNLTAGQKTSFARLNQTVESMYGVKLPIDPNVPTVLSTQFAIMATLIGEPLMNGRSYEHIRTHRAQILSSKSLEFTEKV